MCISWNASRKISLCAKFSHLVSSRPLFARNLEMYFEQVCGAHHSKVWAELVLLSLACFVIIGLGSLWEGLPWGEFLLETLLFKAPCVHFSCIPWFFVVFLVCLFLEENYCEATEGEIILIVLVTLSCVGSITLFCQRASFSQYKIG